ncbi:hypothetical protein [Marinomonas primoryensis]|uniref:Uncharacterized protein n=1 Tax=Marinomonas primoryensis TaxID=178399 RepID=A0ABV0L7N7_9GAMM
MGKSKSIEQQIKEDKLNQGYIDEITIKLNEQTKKSNEEIDEKIKMFYGSNRDWDNSLYIEGSQSDYQLESTWNLDSVSNIINSIAEAVIGTVVGEHTKLPEGTEVSSNANEITEKANLTKDTRLLVAANCFNLLSGLVNSFGSAQSLQINSASSNIPIGQGLRIFATVATRSSQSKSFFENQIVNSYMFIYKVVYSLDEFKQQAEQTLVAQYDRTLNALNIASERNFDNYFNEKITIQQYFTNADLYENKTIAVQEKINAIGTKETIIAIMKNQISWQNRMLTNFGYDNTVRERISRLNKLIE